MKTLTVIFALVTVIFAAPAFADHNKTSLFGLGEKEGHWTEVTERGDIFEGHYVDGERLGPWSARLVDGFVGECLYVKGQQHGDCVLQSGTEFVFVMKGPMVDNKRHGPWTFESNATGNVLHQTWRNGERIN
ncbi:MAG: hypothetical protein OXE47_05970 [Gammaproteobacteria bacterium]|nr:hypothetical protein [Gammaproteobacteria bacterium]MDD9852224.1 hypothetical protein [Gammaproteobacteria bacterium]